MLSNRPKLRNVWISRAETFYGNQQTARKKNALSWKKITKTKNERGLGLQAAKKKNTALLAKLNWRFHQEKDFLWVRVLFP